jgi:hypothetical protein
VVVVEQEEQMEQKEQEQEDVRPVTLQRLLQQTVMLLVQEQFPRLSHRRLLLFRIRHRRRHCLCASSTL